jgi:hypothetical protein
VHTLTALALGFALIAVVAAIWFWLPWFRASLNHTLFADVVIRLIKGGDLERARKLTRAAPSSPFATATRAALDAVDAKTDPKAAFDDALRPEVARLERGQFYATASVIAGVVSGVLVFEYAPPIVMTGSVFAVALIVHAYRIAKALARAGSVEAERIFAALAERATS